MCAVEESKQGAGRLIAVTGDAFLLFELHREVPYNAQTARHNTQINMHNKQSYIGASNESKIVKKVQHALKNVKMNYLS